jgi:hypothetical protein
MEFPFIWLSNLKFVKHKNSDYFHLKCSLFYHFAVPCPPPPGEVTPLPPLSYATA